MATQIVLVPRKLQQRTPSIRDGLSRDTEISQRIYGCQLIQKAGVLLRLEAVTVASAQTILHRFYYRKSLKKFDVRVSNESDWMCLPIYSYISAYCYARCASIVAPVHPLHGQRCMSHPVAVPSGRSAGTKALLICIFYICTHRCLDNYVRIYADVSVHS